MYINPDSRGQCVLGEVKFLLPIKSIQSSFLSLWFLLGSWNVCLAFPKTGCLLGVNQRDTHRPERPSVHLNVCLHALLCMCVFICTYVEDKVFSFFLCSFTMGCNICHAKIWNHFLLTDQKTNHGTIWQPTVQPEMLSAFTVKQHMCAISLKDRTGCRWNRCRHPQSHCALPLLLPVNQSEPSVFVMVEDNQFQNKKKGREGQASGEEEGEDERIKSREKTLSVFWQAVVPDCQVTAPPATPPLIDPSSILSQPNRTAKLGTTLQIKSH